MDLTYVIRLSKVEKEYLKSFSNKEFIEAFNTDKYLRIILDVAKQDYIVAASICNIKFTRDLTLAELILFIETGNPYIETLEEREPYWELVDRKAEQNNTIDLDAYANGIMDGVEWQQEKSYSEEEVVYFIHKFLKEQQPHLSYVTGGITKWFEQFKKK